MNAEKAVRAAATACALLLAPAARAETPPAAEPADDPAKASAPAAAPQDVTIDEVLRMLRQKSPRVAALGAEVEIARSEVVEAKIYPNPRLSYSTYGGIVRPVDVNGSQHQLTVDVPLLVGGQMGARQSAAEAGVSAAEARVTASRADLATQARGLFVQLLAQQERVKAVQASQADLARARGIVEGRAQSGTMSAFDLTRVDVEAQAKASELTAAQADEEDVARRLAALLGRPGWRPRASGAFRPAAATPAPVPAPIVEAAKKEQQAAVARVHVAEREWLPTPVVSVGAFVTSDGLGVAGYLGLSLDLPIVSQGQGAVARANAEARAADLSRTAIEAEANAELQRAKRALETRRKALETYQQKVAAKAPELRQMAEDAYRLGSGTVLDLLDTMRTLAEIRAAEVDYTERALLAEIDLLAASGKADASP